MIKQVAYEEAGIQNAARRKAAIKQSDYTGMIFFVPKACSEAIISIAAYVVPSRCPMKSSIWGGRKAACPIASTQRRMLAVIFACGPESCASQASAA